MSTEFSTLSYFLFTILLKLRLLSLLNDFTGKKYER